MRILIVEDDRKVGAFPREGPKQGKYDAHHGILFGETVDMISWRRQRKKGEEEA
jgi:hypothetical protein